MKEKITPFDKEICYHCLSNNDLEEFYFEDIGWNSKFDGLESKIILCKNCIEKLKPLWIPPKTITVEDIHFPEYSTATYAFEEELFEFIENCDIRIKELFFNQYNEGFQFKKIDSQDWIDYNLGILPHEKCKKYGFISPEETKEYNEKYPNCKHVYNSQIGDIKFSQCIFNAKGDYNGNTVENTSTQCYNCPHFVKRTRNKKYKDIRYQEIEEYNTYQKIKLDPEKLKRFEK